MPANLLNSQSFGFVPQVFTSVLLGTALSAYPVCGQAPRCLATRAVTRALSGLSGMPGES